MDAYYCTVVSLCLCGVGSIRPQTVGLGWKCYIVVQFGYRQTTSVSSVVS